MKTKINLIFIMFLVFGCKNKTTNINKENLFFSFGVIADCQYCNVESVGVRKYAISDKKLMQCVKHLNTFNLEFTIHLGDFIDQKFSSFDTLIPIWDQLKSKSYHVLGNHDFSVKDSKYNHGEFYIFVMSVETGTHVYHAVNAKLVVINTPDDFTCFSIP